MGGGRQAGVVSAAGKTAGEVEGSGNFWVQSMSAWDRVVDESEDAGTAQMVSYHWSMVTLRPIFLGRRDAVLECTMGD